MGRDRRPEVAAPGGPRPEEGQRALRTPGVRAGDCGRGHADVRQGLGAAPGRRGRGRPPPGGRRGAALAAAEPGQQWRWGPWRDWGLAPPRAPPAQTQRLRPEAHRTWGQRPEGDAKSPGAGGKDPHPALRTAPHLPGFCRLGLSLPPELCFALLRSAWRLARSGSESALWVPVPGLSHVAYFLLHPPLKTVCFQSKSPCWWALTLGQEDLVHPIISGCRLKSNQEWLSHYPTSLFRYLRAISSLLKVVLFFLKINRN